MTAQEEQLRQRGYQVQYGQLGWWVSGSGGYLVAGYFHKQGTAIYRAGQVIESADLSGLHPLWYLPPVSAIAA